MPTCRLLLVLLCAIVSCTFENDNDAVMNVVGTAAFMVCTPIPSQLLAICLCAPLAEAVVSELLLTSQVCLSLYRMSYCVQAPELVTLHASATVPSNSKPHIARHATAAAAYQLQHAHHPHAVLEENDSGRPSLDHSVSSAAAYNAPLEGSVSGRATDVWSLGCTLYQFVFGRLPFQAQSVDALYHNIANQP